MLCLLWAFSYFWVYCIFTHCLSPITQHWKGRERRAQSSSNEEKGKGWGKGKKRKKKTSPVEMRAISSTEHRSLLRKDGCLLAQQQQLFSSSCLFVWMWPSPMQTMRNKEILFLSNDTVYVKGQLFLIQPMTETISNACLPWNTLPLREAIKSKFSVNSNPHFSAMAFLFKVQKWQEATSLHIALVDSF